MTSYEKAIKTLKERGMVVTKNTYGGGPIISKNGASKLAFNWSSNSFPYCCGMTVIGSFTITDYDTQGNKGLKEICLPIVNKYFQDYIKQYFPEGGNKGRKRGIITLTADYPYNYFKPIVRKAGFTSLGKFNNLIHDGATEIETFIQKLAKKERKVK
jgi:hypothetical protein